jgi:hypothetical protein
MSILELLTEHNNWTPHVQFASLIIVLWSKILFLDIPFTMKKPSRSGILFTLVG